MKNMQKKLSLLLCIVLSISLLSSCGLFGSSKENKKDEIGQSEVIGTTEGTEEKNSAVQDSTELESESEPESESEVESGVEENVSTENISKEELSTENKSTENSQKPEKENNSQKESQDNKTTDSQNNKPSNNQNNNQNNKPNNDKNDSQESEHQGNSNNQSDKLTTGEKMAKKIVDEIIKADMSDFEKAITIHDWLTFNIDYDFSYSVYDVEETLNKRVAVCQGYALTFEVMAEMAGLETVFIGGTANNGSGAGYQDHAWNRVKLDGTWYNVDVTWDDPATPGKEKNDHSANRYDYFLISDSQINKDHKATDVPSDAGSCSKNYDRLTILKYATNSGKHGNVAVATNAEEVNEAIEKYMKKESTSFWLWYYDDSVTSKNMWDKIHAIIAKCKYPASTTLSYPPENSLTKYQLLTTPMSDWKKIPVVTNGTEFDSLFNTNVANGISEYTLRYESTEGVLDFGMSGGFSYSTSYYNDGKYCLMTIYLQ